MSGNLHVQLIILTYGRFLSRRCGSFRKIPVKLSC